MVTQACMNRNISGPVPRSQLCISWEPDSCAKRIGSSCHTWNLGEPVEPRHQLLVARGPPCRGWVICKERCMTVTA